MNEQSRNRYFALLDADSCTIEAMAKVRDYYDFLSNSGYLEEAKRAYTSYHGRQPYGGVSSLEVRRGGEQGELALLKVNHYRNLIEHLLVMTIGQRPAMETRAINTDYKSQAQTILGNGVLEYYVREHRLERLFKDATKYSLVLDEGFVYMDWDMNSGKDIAVDPNSGQAVKEGDISFQSLTTLDVIRNPGQLAASEDWKIVRTFMSRYELAAQYPEKAEEILNISFSPTERYRYSFVMSGTDESADIPVYTFMHRKSTAVPEGRMLRFLDAKLWLTDGPLPFKRIPVFRIASSDTLGTIFGYSPAKDLLGLQQVVDSLYSIVVSNQTAFGVQNILVPKGHDLNITALQGGMNVIEYDQKLGKPEALQLTQTPAEIFKFIQQVEHTMETISGVNSVARGNPEASLRTGAALALVQSMAVQFSNGLQQSYAALVEDVGTAIIEFLQTFPTNKRIAAIAGKTQKTLLKEFGPEDISQLNRVVVDLSNPVSKTVSGRLEIATQLLQNGMIKNPQQYLMVLQTGRLDPLIENEEQELLTARDENEALMEGKPVKAVITDNHAEHIKCHKAVINTTEARMDPRLVQATLSHIQEHLDLLRQVDPVLLQIIGEQPAPPAAPQQAGPPGAQQNPQSGTGPNVKMPRMPTNPLSGKKGPEEGGPQ